MGTLLPECQCHHKTHCHGYSFPYVNHHNQVFLHISFHAGPGFRQHVHDTAITGNQRGAFYFQNAGELNPSVIIERCRIQDGGIGIYNLTSPHVMSMMVQNSRLMTIANNYVVNNAGGIFVNTTTNSLATAVYANITNNVLVYNTHGEVLHLEGK